MQPARGFLARRGKRESDRLFRYATGDLSVIAEMRCMPRCGPKKELARDGRECFDDISGNEAIDVAQPLGEAARTQSEFRLTHVYSRTISYNSRSSSFVGHVIVRFR